jgi:transcriptional regulator with XRE-family HTH domain
MDALNQTLKKIREARHLSQSQMAEKLDKTQSAYARIEIGDTKIDVETLQKFAEKTEMSMVDIITYPEKWVPATKMVTYPEPKVTLQIELSREKKDQVLKLAFGENILEILNK